LRRIQASPRPTSLNHSLGPTGCGINVPVIYKDALWRFGAKFLDPAGEGLKLRRLREAGDCGALMEIAEH
jgi:hypothetical protein